MALRNKWFNRVESEAGFVVKIRAYQGFVEYREGRRVARVPVEPVMGEPLVHVYKSTEVKWSPPYSDELISEDKRRTILESIVEAMRFRKYAVELV
jgi:hypothetical protein